MEIEKEKGNFLRCAHLKEYKIASLPDQYAFSIFKDI